ncbi:hypothetical protein ACN4EG_25255 [Alkalinema pantanalense CENA528]
MTQIIIEHPKTREGETLELPGLLGFAELRKWLRQHPTYKTWTFIESRVI